MNKFLYGFFFVIALSSCTEYQKALKSESPAIKLYAAKNKYQAGKYEKAIRLFEQIAPTYRGKAEAEDVFYMFAMSYYKTKQYYLAGYQFESFASMYSKSQKVEEASFLGAKSYSMLSPEYSLDQVDTDKAIEKLQNFINKYPSSTYLEEANKLVKGLQDKIEKKAFEIAKQYNTVSDYKAAIKAMDNFILDFPGTPYKEKALFYKLDSSYKLAINSVPSKMEERLRAAKVAYENLLKFNTNTDYKKNADIMLARIDSDLKQFQK
ncbi:MAG: outer membrane protein assembly factor BamD [Limnohabitans sp.]|nr:outer membrane protein assembly factor BamD [Limnohabitans sp.]